jgi:uncharacterized protein (DUF433 family)
VDNVYLGNLAGKYGIIRLSEDLDKKGGKTRGGESMLGFDRITFDPDIMGGRACIRDTRVTVSLIVNLIANGMDFEEILEAYPYLEPDDIQQALQYVAWLAEENVYALELAA